MRKIKWLAMVLLLLLCSCAVTPEGNGACPLPKGFDKVARLCELKGELDKDTQAYVVKTAKGPQLAVFIYRPGEVVIVAYADKVKKEAIGYAYDIPTNSFLALDPLTGLVAPASEEVACDFASQMFEMFFGNPV